jgi:hypothetical protein
MFELIFRPAVAVSLTFLLISAAYRWSLSKPDLPDLPWVGLRNEWFAKFRCRWRTTIKYREYQQIAYQNVSRRCRIHHSHTDPCQSFRQGPSLYPLHLCFRNHNLTRRFDGLDHQTVRRGTQY